MATNMNVSVNYGTHLPALIAVMAKTSGDVLELGTGVFSTPYLHYACMLAKRHLVSYDNSPEWDKWIGYYRSPDHEIIMVDDWDKADIERSWGIALVDHSPSERRKVEIRRLANFAKYVVIHDSNGRFDREYRYSEIYPLFEYKKIWDKDNRHATVLSNFVSLEDLW